MSPFSNLGLMENTCSFLRLEELANLRQISKKNVPICEAIWNKFNPFEKLHRSVTQRHYEIIVASSASNGPELNQVLNNWIFSQRFAGNWLLKSLSILGLVEEQNREFKNLNKAIKIIFLEAVQQDGDALQYASNNLKNDEDIVAPAIQQNRNARQYASDHFKLNDILDEADETACLIT